MKNLVVLLVIVAYVGPLAGEDALAVEPPRKYQHSRATGFAKPIAARIVGGQNAATGQFPFTTAITIDNSFYCTSSLLSHQWIVTAAHCAVDSSTFGVRLGSTNFSINEAGAVTMQSRKVIPHPSYNPDNSSFDIALIMMASQVTYTSKIQPVSLPTRRMASNSFTGTSVRTIGWGVSDDYPTAVSPVLNYVDLQVISTDDCTRTYGDLDATIICANGNGKKGPCGGDSGGPLVMHYDSTPVLVGVTNFGADAGCWGGKPTAFSRVTYHLDWIHSTTGITIHS